MTKEKKKTKREEISPCRSDREALRANSERHSGQTASFRSAEPPLPPTRGSSYLVRHRNWEPAGGAFRAVRHLGTLCPRARPASPRTQDGAGRATAGPQASPTGGSPLAPQPRGPRRDPARRRVLGRALARLRPGAPLREDALGLPGRLRSPARPAWSSPQPATAGRQACPPAAEPCTTSGWRGFVCRRRGGGLL